jgi:hypothetical protein
MWEINIMKGNKLMNKKHTKLIGSNLSNLIKLRNLFFISNLVILSGCAMSPEEKARGQALQSIVGCMKNQASEFRVSNPNEEVYSLFNIAYDNCSQEKVSYLKEIRLFLENKILKDSNRKRLPLQAQNELDKAMVKFENTFKNTNFNGFKSFYNKS